MVMPWLDRLVASTPASSLKAAIPAFSALDERMPDSRFDSGRDTGSLSSSSAISSIPSSCTPDGGGGGGGGRGISISCNGAGGSRSEEHTPELQSIMRISYAVFCL